jgi:hypothetical protein
MEKLWKARVAGILDIIAGVIAIIGYVVLVNFGSFSIFFKEIPGYVREIVFGVSELLAISGLIAIVGGIFALNRRAWSMALAGSIAAFFGSQLLGIAAIILTAISKKEFR